jgi:hypothetical protein
MSDNSFKSKLARIVIQFKKRKQNKHSSPINYEKAKTIGIIYRRVNKTGSTQVDDFIKNLEEDGKKVFSMEYIAKEIDSNYQLKEINHLALRDQDLNSLGIPKKDILQSFCQHNFDMIINLSLANLSQLHYMTALCNASLKVGFYFTGFHMYYDFMVDAKGSLDFKEHLQTMFGFIKQINKNQ